VGRRFAILLLLLGAPAAALAAGSTIYAHGAWVALDRGSSCLALTRSLRIAAKGKVQATAGFAFSPDRRRWGEFHAHLRQMPRPGSSVILTVGDQPFLLVQRGDWAWSSGPQQERAIIAAVRNATAMKVEARDLGGGRFIDPYALDGAPTAIDAAAARCAGKKA